MKRAAIAIAIAAAGLALPAVVQHKPEHVIHYRQAAMTMIGWNFGTLAAMVKGKTAWDAQEFGLRADRIAGLAPQVLEGFAKGSDKGATTDAKPGIWKTFDDFTAKDKNLVEQTRALAEVAKGGDAAAMKEQFKKTAEACKDCHEKYKAD